MTDGLVQHSITVEETTIIQWVNRFSLRNLEPFYKTELHKFDCFWRREHLIAEIMRLFTFIIVLVGGGRGHAPTLYPNKCDVCFCLWYKFMQRLGGVILLLNYIIHSLTEYNKRSFDCIRSDREYLNFSGIDLYFTEWTQKAVFIKIHITLKKSNFLFLLSLYSTDFRTCYSKCQQNYYL